MRRTAGGFLHPSEKWRLGVLNAERLASDPAGVSRVAESDSVWDYLPNEPDLDINLYHLQIDFSSDKDFDFTNFWWGYALEAGAGMEYGVQDWETREDGHAYMQTGDGPGDVISMQRRGGGYWAEEVGVPDALHPELWFAGEWALEPGGAVDVFIGHSVRTPLQNPLLFSTEYIGFIWTNDIDPDGQWYFVSTNPAGLSFSVQLNDANRSGMNKFSYHLSWGTTSLPDGSSVFSPLVDIYVNEQHIGDQFQLYYSMPLKLSLGLTVAMMNQNDPNNNRLLLNFLKQMWEKDQ